jgi:uncharacterized protein YciI
VSRRRVVLAVLGLVLAGCESAPPSRARTPAAPGAPAAAPASDEAVPMERFYLVLLRRGPSWTPEQTPEVKAVLEGHMANIRRLAQEGKLALAGPFLEQEGAGALAGLFVLRVGSREEALAVAGTDPGVQSGRFAIEIFPWLGPQSLGR